MCRWWCVVGVRGVTCVVGVLWGGVSLLGGACVVA